MTPKKNRALKRSVRLIETILGTDSGQDIKILPELIKMVGYQVNPIHINTKTSRENFIQALLNGLERYIHISAHGDSSGFYIHGKSQTHISVTDITEQCCRNFRSPRPLRGRFLTVSACGDPSLDFWKGFHKSTGISAVIASMGDVDFAESAMFYASFYFALLRHPRSSIRAVTSQRLIDFIDAFQRTKGAYLALGGNGAYRLCFWRQGDFKEVI